jgi:predicted amidophosphoribosyltransferase
MAQRLGAELGRQVIEMIQAGAMPKPDCVVPVPVHWARSLLRGINHAEAIAEAAASELEVACIPALRARIASRQAGGDATDRIGNRGRFTLGRSFARHGAALQGAEVLLVDDVRTTGSTTLEAGRALATAGIRGLSIGVLAVADPPRRASLAANVDKF